MSALQQEFARWCRILDQYAQDDELAELIQLDLAEIVSDQRMIEEAAA